MGHHRFGYAGMNTALQLSTNRTCRLQHITGERLRSLISENLQALERILSWNARHGIGMFRIGSGIIPFGSHPEVKFPWWDIFADDFARLGQQAWDSDIRLSMHPGQYVNINSPTPGVVESSIADLLYHARIFQALRLPPSSKMVIHVGGFYGDKAAALGRFIQQYQRLPQQVKAHLVLEHDDKIFNFEDVYQVYEETGIPLVFDNLHHALNQAGSSTDQGVRHVLQRCFSTWRPETDGRPKIHYASPAPGQPKGAHAKSIDLADFLVFFQETGDLDYDVMFECKDKEQSTLRVMEALGINIQTRSALSSAI